MTGFNCECCAAIQTSVDERGWYVGDSTTDVIAAKHANVVAIFYNGVQWSEAWVGKISPGTERHPRQPDAVIQNFGELLEMTQQFVTAELLCDIKSNHS